MRDTIDMAREAGLFTHKEVQAELKAFEALVRADERALAAPMQEPVAWINAEKRTFEWNGPVLWNTPTVAVLDKIPLYTTPPAAQRQWVGLTDEEEVELWESTDSDWELMKRTEAKLKEKNT